MQEQVCPRCGSQAGQQKAGFNKGRQQYRCGQCGRRYVLEPGKQGYGDDLRERAIQLRGEGYTLSHISDSLGVTARTLSNWFRAQQSQQETPQSNTAVPAEESTANNTSVKRRATIHDVAEKAGVAASTVSNFLNCKGSISSAMKARIQSAIDELHFTPNALMRAIRDGRTRILGVLNYNAGLDENGDVTEYSFASRITQGMEDAADAAKHDLLVYVNWWNRTRDGSLPILDGHIDGLLISGPDFNEPILEVGSAAGLPMVALLSRHVPQNVGYINTDNIGAMHMIVEHLVSLGRRRIGSIIPTYTSNHLDRYIGIREALNAFNLPYDNDIVKQVPPVPWTNDRYNKLIANTYSKLIDSAGRLDAIVASDDFWARWVLNTLKERGIRVPDDIAVVGFDDVRFARIAGLTTIRQPFRKIGQLAVQSLIAMIEGAPASEYRITVPGELIVRSTTVAPSES